MKNFGPVRVLVRFMVTFGPVRVLVLARSGPGFSHTQKYLVILNYHHKSTKIIFFFLL